MNITNDASLLSVTLHNRSKAAQPPTAPASPACFLGSSLGSEVVESQLATWLPQLARFAASPVSRVDLRCWMDDTGLPVTCRPTLSQYLHEVPLGAGVGVVFGERRNE